MTRVAVVGGGASGLIAAVRAAQMGADVTVYERGERVGKKILSTGNGRCNLTNINADVSHYHGQNPKFMMSALSRFSVGDTLEFFGDLGLLTKTEDEGRVYPRCGQASAVLDVLRMALERFGINVVCGFEVKDVRKNKGGFLIEAYDGSIEYADRVILAAGGRAAPSLGSNGSGYEIAKRLGHTITPLAPALVQIKTNTAIVKSLKGLKIDARLTIESGGQAVANDKGEALFTDYGISGIPAFQLSRYAKKGADAVLDLTPEYTREELKAMLEVRKYNGSSLEAYFTGMFQKRVGHAVLKTCGLLPLSRSADSLSSEEILSLAATIKAWRFPIEGTLSWNNAQVTSGGVSTKEVSPTTMESKLVRGLYITGELLDIDGDCGGYNLQWAWSSGYTAGEAAAE